MFWLFDHRCDSLRYTNFPIGTTKEQEVVAAASCCLEGIRLRVTDVAGKVGEQHAIWDGTGSGGLSTTAIYAIIGACAAVVLIIVVVVAVVLCKKYKYDAVSENPWRVAWFGSSFFR